MSEHSSLEERISRLPASVLQSVLVNAGIDPELDPGNLPHKSWGFTRNLPSTQDAGASTSDREDNYIVKLERSSTFACPDSLPAMLKAYNLPSDIFQGSTIVREHNIDVELQSSREQLKSSIQLAWSQEAVEKGVARAKAGHLSQALECYKQALERCPINADALVAAGAARANQEDLLGALQCFDDALALLPEDANALKYRQAVSDRLQNVTKPDSRRSSDAGAGVSGREGGKGMGSSDNDKDRAAIDSKEDQISEANEMDTEEALRVVSQHYEKRKVLLSDNSLNHVCILVG